MLLSIGLQRFEDIPYIILKSRRHGKNMNVINYHFVGHGWLNKFFALG